MDAYEMVSCKEFLNALENLSEALNRYSICGYNALYNAIVSLSSTKFADEVVDIVDAEHNVYGYEEMYQRMEDTLNLLRRGVAQDKIRELLETQTEHIAMNFVRRGF